MIYTTSRWREAERVAKAITTITGYAPSVFIEEGGYYGGRHSRNAYRVQTDDLSQDAGEALIRALADGVRCDKITEEIIFDYMDGRQL